MVSFSFLRFLRVLVVSLLAVHVHIIHAQQEPFVKVEKFDYSQSFRTNVCDRQRQLWANSIALPDALRGLNLTVAITDYRVPNENEYFTLVDGKIKEKDPGIFVVVLDEVARRAGFSWRDSFAVFEPLNSTTDPGKSWTDILLWSVTTFDISMEKWGRGVDRMSLGISFPAGWWDSSIILGERFETGNTDTSKVNLWGFLRPFTTGVWLMIGAFIVFTGLAFWVLEYLDVRKELGEESVLVCIFHAGFSFTGNFEYSPRNHASRILTFSWSFWALIVAAAYTANLASFLVSPKVTLYQYNTVDKVIAKGARVCVQNNGIIQEILRKEYPDLQLVPQDTEQGIFDGLRREYSDGGCDAFAHQSNTFEIYERSAEVNYDCSISSEKRRVKIIEAGMATAVDTGTYRCTSLVSHVLNYYMREMLDDGFIEEAWKKFLARTGTIECIDETSKAGGGGDDDTFRLTLEDVGGIFIVHIVASLAAVSLAFFQFYYNGTPDNTTLSSVFGMDQLKWKWKHMGHARETQDPVASSSSR